MSGDALREESSQKRRRGRPEKFPDTLLTAIPSNRRTRRGRVEEMVYGHAFTILRAAYYADPTANKWAEYYIDPNKVHVFHTSILAALGRLDDEADMLASARIIAERRMNTRAAVAAIRRARTGITPRADILDLCKCIENAMRDYSETHADTTPALIVRALREMTELYAETAA